MNNKFAVLTFSLRATERVPTLSGSRLDSIRIFDEGVDALLSNTEFAALGDDLLLDREDICKCAKLTSVMRSNIANLFDEVRLLRTPQPLKNVRLGLEGCHGDFEIDHVLICKSSKDKAGQVEGDNMLFVIFLRMILRSEQDIGTIDLNQRFATAKELWEFLFAVGVLVELPPVATKDCPPGFYILQGDRILKGEKYLSQAKNWLNGEDGERARIASSLICAYLFYSWLLCLRTERLAMSIDVNGDWDEECRKLILARKKLAVARRYALLKNRAMPDSYVLLVFRGVSQIYRLEGQLENLVGLLDELSKTLETQNSYVASSRLRAIEAIIFASTILGLGVALNSIQMKPFYEAGTDVNTLFRTEFWTVFGVVFCAAIVCWWMLVHGRKARLKIKQYLSQK